MHRRLATRDLVCLLLGLILGAAMVWGLPLFSTSRGWFGRRTLPDLPSTAVTAAAPGDVATSPTRRSIDLATASTELRSPGETRPRSLLLLGKLDKETLRALALAIPSWPEGRQRDLTLHDVYQRWGEIEPRAAILQAQRVKMPLGLSAVHAAVRGFVESDPAHACLLLAAPPTADQGPMLRVKTFRDGELAEALLNWSEQDPQAAIEFLLQLSPRDLGPRTVTSVTTAWARQDPVVALGWASQLGNPLLRTDAMRGAVSAWAETDPAAAANYVSTLPLGFQRDLLTETVVHGWVQQDPPAAADWASAQTGLTQGRALEAVAAGWADEDAPAAAAWAVQLPVGRVRDQAWKAVASAWSLHDGAAAAVWLGELPPGTSRDAAIVGFSEGRASVDPPQTLTWVQQIGNPMLRDETTVRILQAWLPQNPEAAQQWISQTPLPRAIRAQLGFR